MLELIKKLFGSGAKVNFAELVENGALILDVRTKNEFMGGHIKGAVNIPFDQLGNNLGKLRDKSRCIIVYCASGARSSVAKNALSSFGYSNVYNGGGIRSLQQKLR